MCCRCNRTGQCRGCACVKAGQPCSNCLPSRLGSCSNASHRQDPTQSATLIPPPTPTPTPPTPSGRSPTPANSVHVVVSGSDVVSTHKIPETPVQNQLIPFCAHPWTTNPPVLHHQYLAYPRSLNWLPLISFGVRWTLPAFASPSERYTTRSFSGGRLASRYLLEMPASPLWRSWARLYSAFANGSALESIALMATTVLPILTLQLPHKRSKVKQHIKCLERRLKAWSDGDLTTLVNEGRTIQQRLPKTSRANAENEHSLT